MLAVSAPARAAHVAIVALAFVACGAVADGDAERAALAGDRALLEARIAELEAALTAAPTAAPAPTLADRLILRQFVRDPDRPDGGALTVALCLELFGRGDPLAGIPPALTTSCIPLAVLADAGPARAIEAFVGDPLFACWASAVPGLTLPGCWP